MLWIVAFGGQSQDFWGEVRQRSLDGIVCFRSLAPVVSDHALTRLVKCKNFTTKSEVSQQNVEVAVDQEILWLEISMAKQLFLVHVVDGVDQLNEQEESGTLAQILPRNELVQVLLLGEVHDEVGAGLDAHSLAVYLLQLADLQPLHAVDLFDQPNVTQLLLQSLQFR